MNLNLYSETIAAIATPPGRGGIGIIRISGELVKSIAKEILGFLPQIRQAYPTSFKDKTGKAIDYGIALFFENPHSFTGEDVLELQGHGGFYLQQLLLERVTELGARLAQPGEFSLRAFLNHKIDLVQAEAIADLIDAGSAEAAKAAINSLQGDFSKVIHELVKSLIYLRTYVEAAIDFPDEEIDFLQDQTIISQLQELLERFNQVIIQAQQGILLKQGMTVVIVGAPNVGKSSLLNRLAGEEVAIVTHLPGTTRDLLKEHIQIDGMPLHLVDTAGFRESNDPIEQEGISRAKKAIEYADHLLFLTDDFNTEAAAHFASVPAELIAPFLKVQKVTLIRNKIDQAKCNPFAGERKSLYEIHLSALTGEGFELLKARLKSIMGFQEGSETHFIARKRHLDAILQAQEHVQHAFETLQKTKAGELMAEDLRLAQLCLNEITGEFSSDDLLGKIFSSFCIGK